MATYPFSHFALTDPVAAQQVVSMAQIAQQEQAERDRARVGTLSSITQGNVARENAAQQRAYSQSQLAQRESEMAQQQRQFDVTDKYRNRALDESAVFSKSDLANRSELELFNALQNEVTSPNPPTDLEFEARTLGMTPQRKEILNRLRLNTAMDLNRQADIAENTAARWNARIGVLNPDQKLERDAVIKEFTSSKDRNYIDLDATTGTFKSLLRRPRRDPDASAVQPAVPIQDILAQLPPPSGTGGVLGLAGRGLTAGMAGLQNILPWLRGSAAPAAPAAPTALPRSTGFIPRDTDFPVPPLEREPSYMSTDSPPIGPQYGPPLINVIPQSQILRGADSTPRFIPRMGDLRMAEQAAQPPHPLQLYLNDPEGFIPRYRYELNPAQRAEVIRWIQSNPAADHKRISDVVDFIISRGP